MAAILLHKSIEEGHGLLVVGVIGGKILVNDGHRTKGELPVGPHLGIVDSDECFQIGPNTLSGIFSWRLGAVIKVGKLALAVDIPIVVKVHALRKHSSSPDFLPILLDGNICS